MNEQMCINILTDSDLDRLADATLRILEQAGVMYQSESILDALAAAGATVDRESQRARLPRPMIERIIEHQRRRQAEQVVVRAEGPELVAGAAPPAANRREPVPLDTPLQGVHLQVAQFYFDHERNERRAGNRQDYIRMVQFGDALDERLPVNHVLLMREEHHLVEPLEAVLVLLEHTSRPGNTYPHFAAQFPYLEEMGQIYAGDPKRFVIGMVFMVSPLRMDRRACDFMVGKLQRGLQCSVGTQPVSGVSAPVTRAGVIASGAAEILAGWAASFALAPEAPLSGAICSGSVDMATGNVTFCSPEAMIQDIGCVELFRRRLGGHVGVAGVADYTSAKFPGYQAGFEKAFEAMAVSAYTGHYPELGAGLLESGKMFSPLQLLIDRELQTFLLRFAAGAQVNQDEIALDLISEIGSRGGSYLESEHTLRHFRQSLWFPTLVDRSVWRVDRDETHPDQRLLERALAQFREVLARYRPPQVDHDMLAKLRQVVDKARRELA